MLRRRRSERPFLWHPASPEARPGSWASSGPPGFGLLAQSTGTADLRQLGWIYWAWKYYDDPTGSSDEALAAPDGRPGPTASVLAQVYPQAVAGRPVSFGFDPGTARFELVYIPSSRVRAPTVVAVPRAGHYPTGYCTTVEGGRIISAPGADQLLVVNDRSAGRVTITLNPGRCPSHGGGLVAPTTTAPTTPHPTTTAPTTPHPTTTAPS